MFTDLASVVEKVDFMRTGANMLSLERPHRPCVSGDRKGWKTIKYALYARSPHDWRLFKVGYEIPHNRHFYRYEPPRPLKEIQADIKTLEGEIIALLKEVTA